MTDLEKEYSNLLETAGLEDRPIMIEVMNPVSKKPHSQLINHYKNAMRYFRELSEELQKGEIAELKGELNIK